MDQAKLARVARKIKDNESHYGLEYTPVFMVPIAFFVNNSVTVDNLSTQQVLDIFAGKITNWQEVGGKNKIIQVIRREEEDSALINLRNLFPGFKDLVISEKARQVETTPTMIAQIHKVEDTISWGPLDVGLANNLKALKINNIDPASEAYPYFGEVALVYKAKNLTGNAKKFVDFATSAAAHDAIAKAGGISLK